MGLRDDIQADIAEAFSADLADAVRAFTLTRVTRSGYDPITGNEDTVTETFEGRGVFGSFKREEVDEQHILATDEKLLGLQNESDTVPAIGDDIDGKRAMNVWADPAAVTWTVQLRDA